MKFSNDIVTMVVKKDSSRAEFIHTSKFTPITEGAKDLETEVRWKELCFFADRLRCKVSRDKVIAENQSEYDKLLIFAAVRPTLKHKSKVSDLIDVISKLNGYDLNYWALQFKKAFWFEERSQIERVAKSFTVLFGLTSP